MSYLKVEKRVREDHNNKSVVYLGKLNSEGEIEEEEEEEGWRCTLES